MTDRMLKFAKETLTDIITGRRLDRMDRADIRNAGKTLKRLRFSDPVTAQHRADIMAYVKAGNYALAGGLLGLAPGLMYALGNPKSKLGPLVPAITGAAGFGAGLLAAAMLKESGKWRGMWEDTDSKIVEEVYNNPFDARLEDLAAAKSHLDKLVQTDMINRKMKAPTEVVS